MVANAVNDALDPALTVVDDGCEVIDGAYCTVNTTTFEKVVPIELLNDT